MKRYSRILSLLLVMLFMFSVMASCTTEKPSEQTTPDTPYQPPGDEYKLPLEDGYNQLTLYWKYFYAIYIYNILYIKRIFRKLTRVFLLHGSHYISFSNSQLSPSTSSNVKVFF